MPIAFMGPAHSFSERAAHLLAPDAAPVPLPDIPALFVALRSRTADAAVVPIENSAVGAVSATIDELLALAAPLGVASEVTLPIRFSLYARGPVDRIASHAMSLKQCAAWLAARGVATEATGSTGTAIARAASGEEPGLAAIGPQGLTVPGLVETETDLQGPTAYATRFLLLSPATPATPATPVRALLAVRSLANLPLTAARALAVRPTGCQRVTETILEAEGAPPWPGRPLLLWMRA